jgi:uncharacterized small protein (DUF1192 family)
MPLFDEETPKKKVLHEIGQDLAMLSVAEIDERIALLKGEVERLEAMKASKGSHRSVADAFFKR